MRHRLVVTAAVLALGSAAFAGEPATGAGVNGVAVAAAAQGPTPEERAEVRELLAITHALEVGEMFSRSIVKDMTQALKNARPDLPQRAFDLLAEEVNATVSDEMRAEGGFEDLLFGLYRKHFTRDEIRALIAFYKTPVGSKLAAKQPVLAQEAMEIGAIWGEALGPKIVDRVKKRLEREEFRL